MASSVNGIIARKNYEEDFLSDYNWTTFTSLAEEHGCVIMGRKTYDVVNKWEDHNFYAVNARKIVLSRKVKKISTPGFQVAHSLQDALHQAKKLGFKTVLLSGGSKANSAFMKSNLIDEIILNVEPVVIGKGIHLFSEDSFEARLKLVHLKKLPNKILQLKYLVRKK